MSGQPREYFSQRKPCIKSMVSEGYELAHSYFGVDICPVRRSFDLFGRHHSTLTPIIQ